MTDKIVLTIPGRIDIELSEYNKLITLIYLFGSDKIAKLLQDVFNNGVNDDRLKKLADAFEEMKVNAHFENIDQ